MTQPAAFFIGHQSFWINLSFYYRLPLALCCGNNTLGWGPPIALITSSYPFHTLLVLSKDADTAEVKASATEGPSDGGAAAAEAAAEAADTVADGAAAAAPMETEGQPAAAKKKRSRKVALLVQASISSIPEAQVQVHPAYRVLRPIRVCEGPHRRQLGHARLSTNQIPTSVTYFGRLRSGCNGTPVCLTSTARASVNIAGPCRNYPCGGNHKKTVG